MIQIMICPMCDYFINYSTRNKLTKMVFLVIGRFQLFPKSPRVFVNLDQYLQVKVGHGGTLDPMATGVLVIGVGRGCRELGKYLQV